MKTFFCYKTIFRYVNHSFNEGFIFVEITNNEINIEGLLTNDYLKGYLEGNEIRIDIFAYSYIEKYAIENLVDYFYGYVPLEKFVLPMKLEFFYEGDRCDHRYELTTVHKIEDQNIIEKYKKQLEDYKKTKVFTERF